MWVKVDVRPWVNQRHLVPDAPGVYAFIRDGRVVYVGQTVSLRRRLSEYWYRWVDFRGGWIIDPRIQGCVVKYSASRRYGDWLMREYRLIRRLQPLHNIVGRERRA